METSLANYITKEFLTIGEEIEHGQGLVLSTRQWSETYGTYSNELVGPETYTTTEMALFFSWHESHRTSMGWSPTTEQPKNEKVSNSSLEWNRQATLEKTTWFTFKPIKWSYSYERIFNYPSAISWARYNGQKC